MCEFAVLRKIFSVLLYLLFFQSIFSEKVQLVISANLSGNLYSCQCGLKKSVGLLKRYSFLKENKLERSILLDIGSSLDSVYDTKKANLVYKTFSRMGYVGVGLGVTDLDLKNLPNLQSGEFPIISSNIVSKKIFTTELLTRPYLNLKTQENEISILTHLSESEFFLSNPIIFKKIQILSFKESIRNINLRKPLILLHKGNIEEAFQIKKRVPEILVISNSTESTASKNISIKRDGLEVFQLVDKLGDTLLILDIEVVEKQLRVLKVKILKMDYKKLKDDGEILDLFQKNNFSIPN